jgi:hypothetical protein
MRTQTVRAGNEKVAGQERRGRGISTGNGEISRIVVDFNVFSRGQAARALELLGIR